MVLPLSTARSALNSLYHTVLVVEDDTFFAALVKRVLETHGYSVVTATSGRAASALLAKVKFDLIVTDGRLPDASGAEWLTSLRASGETTPAILMSSLFESNAQAVIAAGQLGIEGAVRKADGLRALYVMVASLLGPASDRIDDEPATMRRTPHRD